MKIVKGYIQAINCFHKKGSMVDVRLGSKYASVNITLCLTFIFNTIFKVLPEKKTLSVCVKDKSCNSPEVLQLY